MWAEIRRMFWRRMIPVVVATMAAAILGSHANQQLTAAYTLAATIEESPLTVGLADSNLARLGDMDLINKQLDMMQAIGVQNIRVGISWYTVQPTKVLPPDWGLIDDLIDEANRRGMGVLGVLHETPHWAGDPIISGSPDPIAFGEFAGTVAEKFEGKISAIEVWNEPNAVFFMNPVSPSAYTDMLKAAYEAIKSVDDSITVIGGVLGSGRTLGDDGSEVTMNPVEFLAGMYAAGAHGYFDALSFHPYKYDMKFSEQADQLASPLVQLRHLRDLMEIFGDEDLKIWASEYGLPTDPYDPQFPGQYISPEQQADFIEDFLNSWGKEDGTGPIFIYSTRDLNTGSTSDQDNFGIWETDWTEKPAVDVIRDFLAPSGSTGNPILDAIKTAICNLIQFTGQVIRGAVEFAVDVVTAIVDATVWVIKTITKATVAVVKGIANAIGNTVHAIVDRIKDCLGIDEQARSATVTTSLAAARSAGPAATKAEPDTSDTSDTVDSTTTTAAVESPTATEDAGTPSTDVQAVTEKSSSTTEPAVAKAETVTADPVAATTESASPEAPTGKPAPETEVGTMPAAEKDPADNPTTKDNQKTDPGTDEPSAAATRTSGTKRDDASPSAKQETKKPGGTADSPKADSDAKADATGSSTAT